MSDVLHTEQVVIATNVHDRVRRVLRQRYGSLRKAGKELGVSGSYLSEVNVGDKPPNKTLLDMIGVERRIVYVVKSQGE